MANKSFEEIKCLFENRSYFVRWQFLNEYHFNDNYHDYYVDFICKNALFLKNDNYLSDLVCFTIDFNIFDSVIIDIWYQILKESTSAIVVLSILDYFNLCALAKLPKDYASTLLAMADKHRRRLLKNQVYINLLLLNEADEKYKNLLTESLNKTKDYRSILRVISTLTIFHSRKIVREIKNHIGGLKLEFLDNKLKASVQRAVTDFRTPVAKHR